MGEIIPAGEYRNEAEKDIAAMIAVNSPDRWVVVTNPDIPLQNGQLREVDLIVVADEYIAAIDVKGAPGPVTIAGPGWRQGPSVGHNAAAKILHNARVLKSLLVEADPTLSRVHVEGLVALAHPGARLADSRGPYGRVVVRRDDLLDVLRDAGRRGKAAPLKEDPGRRGYLGDVLRALNKVIGVRTDLGRFGSWKVVERLPDRDPGRLTEYLAVKAINEGSGTVLLQKHSVHYLQTAAERAARTRLICNAYEALRLLRRPHPNVIRVYDVFPIPGESEIVVVMDHHGALPRGRVPELIPEMLNGLAHLHDQDAVHRGLCRDALVVDAQGHAVITRFDHARTGPHRGASSIDAETLLQAAEDAYLAPECRGRPDRIGKASDVYAAGVLACELAVGVRPTGPGDPVWGTLADALGPRRAAIVRRMCSPDPRSRPTAGEALAVFTGPEEPDYADLPEGFMVDEYQVVRRLGGPGAHGVAYRAHDTHRDRDCVVKLFHRDPEHDLTRVRREHQALKALAAHPGVVTMWDMGDHEGVPYLVLKYVPGDTLARIGEVEPGAVREIGEQLADALAYLHENKTHHRDVTPGNVLWTGRQGVLIDFNLASFDGDQVTAGTGSPRYTPPDQPADRDLTPAELADHDVYGLALCLYEALAGRYPWDTGTPPPEVPPPDLADLADAVPADLSAALGKALSPHREDRYPDARAFLDALRYGGEITRRDRVPRLLIIDDHHTATIVDELGDAYDCVPLKSLSDWERLLEECGGQPDADGAIVDLHLSPGGNGEGISILRYLRDHTTIPAAIITNNTRRRDDEQNNRLRLDLRGVRLQHKRDDAWLDDLRSVAETLTARVGTEAVRRLRAWLESARFWMEDATGRAGGDQTLWARRRALNEDHDEVIRRLAVARTAADFAELTGRVLRLWAEWAPPAAG